MTVDSRWTDEIEHTTALADQILTLLDGVPLPVAAAAAGLALTRVLRAIGDREYSRFFLEKTTSRVLI